MNQWKILVVVSQKLFEKMDILNRFIKKNIYFFFAIISINSSLSFENEDVDITDGEELAL
jgi:hypothetical protein